ncbi:unnamed protein product [Paramecium primaurelia]|uniref:G-protein coupled receptors family 2 profile 2 domain-containing protein n=1 Tax=Paramecium primaurelia TaxID=5886 RepID=A0A8S1LHS6_PARPR|nr:unnamed protein product [Paramecium primaurelia]
MFQCQNQKLEEVYQEHCEQNLNNTDKIVNFILRILILIVSILSSLFVLLIIRKSNKTQFWPFKLIKMQVISELIDLTFALLFTINSSCWPKVCKFIAYIMHSNWLASLNFMLFQCFIYFCLIKSELLFNYIMNYLKYFIIFLYIVPYGILFFVLYDDGFGPSGWYLQNGEFNFIFCGFINNQLIGFWITPVSIIFILSIMLSLFNSYYWYHLKNKKGLKYPALRIQSIIIFPLLYSFAWIINFLIRLFDTDANNQNYCPIKEMNWVFYIFYLILNLGFELHLTLGAILFYFIYRYIF